jgi:putative two-component system response regulator
MPEAILLDIDMPVMNGYEAVKTLKSKPETKDIPVILLAWGEDSHGGEKEAIPGAAGRILKPFDPQTLLTFVEKYV